MVRMRIAVIGCGVIGLSTALRLREILPPEYEITAFGKELPPNTTGDSAAGLWMPIYFGKTSEEDLLKWSQKTWDFLQELLTDPSHPDKGVYVATLYKLYTSTKLERPFWADVVYTYYQLSQAEVKRLLPVAETGFQATTIMAEGRRIIDYLLKRYISKGGRCLQKEIMSFDELVDEGFEVIVNCSGLGAKRLCDDSELYPVRGQIHFLNAPAIRNCMVIDDNFYILPNQNFVVIGGTHQEGDWDVNVRDEDRRSIFSGCSQMMPSVMTAPVIREWVGLRPGRTEVRLEREEKTSASGRPYSVIHNYGHGGSGLTVFWGCAEDAQRLVLDALRPPRSRL